jgi:hypothetical protein
MPWGHIFYILQKAASMRTAEENLNPDRHDFAENTYFPKSGLF